MEAFHKLIKKISSALRFKDSLTEGDIVAVVIDNVLVYGMVLSIERDFSKKDEWWHVKFLLFASLPPLTTTWILRTAQIVGEPFTMDGEWRFLAPLDVMSAEEGEDNNEDNEGNNDSNPNYGHLRLVKDNQSLEQTEIGSYSENGDEYA